MFSVLLSTLCVQSFMRIDDIASKSPYVDFCNKGHFYWSILWQRDYKTLHKPRQTFALPFLEHGWWNSQHKSKSFLVPKFQTQTDFHDLPRSCRFFTYCFQQNNKITLEQYIKPSCKEYIWILSIETLLNHNSKASDTNYGNRTLHVSASR